VTSGEDEPHVSDDASGGRGLPRAVPCGASVAGRWAGVGVDFHEGCWSSHKLMENHRKTIGKWWFNGGLTNKMVVSRWDLPSGYD